MSETLKDRMERLHKALLLKRLMKECGVEVETIQELLDAAKAKGK